MCITGASSGIGYELARYLSESGAIVYACARSAIRTLPKVCTAAVDLRDPASVQAWVTMISEAECHVDMLLNNAAVMGQRAPFHDIPFDVWTDTVATNILGTVAVTRAMLPLLRNSQGATIVNVGSIMGRFGRAGFSPYVMTKFALEGFTQVLAQELFHYGIRAVTLHPARLNTPLRRLAYGEEGPFAPEHLISLLDAVRWILDHPHEPLSGLTLSTDDLVAWAQDSDR